MTEERNDSPSREQQNKGYDAFIIHEFSTGNKLALSIKEGLQRFGITIFVAPSDVPTGVNEECARQSALKNAKEIVVIITNGMILRPGEAKNEIKAVLDAGQESKIKPYRKKRITAKMAVDFLIQMGITFKMQCPAFDDECEIIDDILSRKANVEYSTQVEINEVPNETNAASESLIQNIPKLVVSCEIYRITQTRHVNGYGKVPNINSPFDLRVYIYNEGNASAKHAIVIVSLQHLKLIKIIEGPNLRINNLRGGIPTLQWNAQNEVVLGKSSGMATSIWDLRLKPDPKWFGSILWEIYAEGMKPIKGELAVISIGAAQYVLNHGERCFLREYSAVYPS